MTRSSKSAAGERRSGAATPGAGLIRLALIRSLREVPLHLARDAASVARLVRIERRIMNEKFLMLRK